jgi:hypothetical protein
MGRPHLVRIYETLCEVLQQRGVDETHAGSSAEAGRVRAVLVQKPDEAQLSLTIWGLGDVVGWETVSPAAAGVEVASQKPNKEPAGSARNSTPSSISLYIKVHNAQ